MQINHNKSIKIIPLGGLGRIGNNMLIVEIQEEILIIDAGGRFPENELNGVDLIIPDFKYIEQNAKKVKGLLITHGHEDHIAAIPHLQKKLKIPIYAPKFASEIILNKFTQNQKLSNLDITPISKGIVYKIGNFKVKWFEMCHSIPDSTGIFIETPFGKIIHTGDFKIDHNPIIGNPSNLAELANIAKEKILLLMADSTNANEEGYSGSDKEVFENLFNIISKAKGRVFISSFASQISRMQMIFYIAKLCERKISFAGRSMIRNAKISKDLNYLEIPNQSEIPLSQSSKLADNKVIIMITGSQSEPGSSLVKLSCNQHKKIKIKKDDTVIISASVIPGNEIKVNRAIDNLVRLGAKVITEKNFNIHVSGHAKKEELSLIINLIKPHLYLPIHGDHRMLQANANIAKENGIEEKNIFVLDDGNILELQGKSGKISGNIPSGTLYIDKSGNILNNTNLIESQSKPTNNGVISIACIREKKSGKLLESVTVNQLGISKEKNIKKIIRELQNIIIKSIIQNNSKKLNLEQNEKILEQKSRDYISTNIKIMPIVIISTIQI